MSVNWDNIVEETERLTEEIRQDRLSRGLPENPPDTFVSESLSAELVNRLKPFEKISIAYAKLLMGSGQVHRINTAKLDKYRKVGELLTMSNDVLAGVTGAMVLHILRHMEDANEAISKDEYVDADDIAGSIYLAVKLFGRGSVYPNKYETYDTVRFIQETLRARRQYESIRHLI